jgi:hypothetical protein
MERRFFRFRFARIHQMLWLSARGFDDWYLNFALMGVPPPPPAFSATPGQGEGGVRVCAFLFSPKQNLSWPALRQAMTMGWVEAVRTALQTQQNRRFSATATVRAQFENWEFCTGGPLRCQANCPECRKIV